MLLLDKIDAIQTGVMYVVQTTERPDTVQTRQLLYRSDLFGKSDPGKNPVLLQILKGCILHREGHVLMHQNKVTSAHSPV